ncbi:MAG: chromate transporter [Proteobacteria bacterium]|nr:chromate transporter [Pseudomonadota bacterium]MDA1330954.1 chromate transporter [Pseudomonadota bacterium]
MSLKHLNQEPRTLFELFYIFSLITLQGFGGVVSIMQRHLVEQRRWFSQAEFLEMFSLSQVLPGPNVCNLALMIGDRFFGRKGALVALSGMIVLPMFVILTLAGSYDQISAGSHVAGAIKGMSVVVVGMTLGTALRLLSGIQTNVVGRLIPTLVVLLVFYLVGYLRVPIFWAILFCGGGSCVWAHLSLKHRRAVKEIEL